METIICQIKEAQGPTPTPGFILELRVTQIVTKFCHFVINLKIIPEVIICQLAGKLKAFKDSDRISNDLI